MNAAPLNTRPQQANPPASPVAASSPNRPERPKPAWNIADRPKPKFRPPAEWEVVHAEYVQGLFSTRSLAARHGIPLSTLQARCRREGWVEDRAGHLEMTFEDRISADELGEFA